MIPLINSIDEYDVVVFKNKEINQRVNVYRVSDDLVVGYNNLDSKHFRIYYEPTGMPASPKVFDNAEEAISYAEWLEETYQEYLPLLTEYPKADIVSLTQWSVRNGKEINQILQGLPKKVNLSTINKEMECLKEY